MQGIEIGIIGLDACALVGTEAVLPIAQQIQRHTHREIGLEGRVHRDEGAFGCLIQGTVPVEDTIEDGFTVLGFADLKIGRVGTGLDIVSGGIDVEQARWFPLNLAAENEARVEVDAECAQGLCIAPVDFAYAFPHMACGFEHIGDLEQAFPFLGLVFLKLTHHGLSDGQVAGGEQNQYTLAGAFEQIHLTIGVDLVDPRIGAGVGKEHETGVHQHADAVSHDWGLWVIQQNEWHVLRKLYAKLGVRAMHSLADKYPAAEFFDELIAPDGRPRPAAQALFDHLEAIDSVGLDERRQAVNSVIMTTGITFTAYGEAGNIDRAWPFDVLPRVMDKREWDRIEAGLKQRLTALNLFIDDLYNKQQVVKDGVFPLEVLAGAKNFRKQCKDMTPRFGVWVHVCGTDLLRDRDGTVYVLEDNLRVPSGVSYMLENRQLMKRLFPELFESSHILPVDDYPTRLYDTLAVLSPRQEIRPVVAVLTPGIFNSAYFEHSYLAQKMGAFLVEGSDLMVQE